MPAGKRAHSEGGVDIEPNHDSATGTSHHTGSPRRDAFSLDAVDPDALKVVRRLLSAGHEAYLVGGCVRDLYLGRRPKDFDVATSATPEEIRKLFRNSRIIGRRFKLAHVYFGPKIIETSTFRATPPPQDTLDPLITHDNVWGCIEDDARRRDFTINGLFFDVEDRRIVDFVEGMDDLDRRIIRTIGDPALRFQEDPVRMIRAVKFAARLGFQFEDQTWKALVDVSPDIVKCSQARLLEEIYKLLRGGAAQRGFELMLTSHLAQYVMPTYLALFDHHDGLHPPGTRALPDEGKVGTAGALFWRYLEAVDDYHGQTQQVASNGVLQAAMFAPLLGPRMVDESRQHLDRLIDGMMTPVGATLGIARRDRELARQILMAQHRMMAPSNRKRRRSSLVNRQYFHDALIFFGVAVKATGGDGGELEQWQRLAAVPVPTREDFEHSTHARKKRRRRGGRKRRRDGKGGAPPPADH